MTAASRWRGHLIEWRDGQYIFCDTGESVEKTWRGRFCGRCSQPTPASGHDACLGTLPGVMNACCGHGEAEEAYVQLDDGTIIPGQAALDLMEEMG